MRVRQPTVRTGATPARESMTLRVMRLVAFVLFLIAATPVRSDACDAVTPYELFDRADRVIVGKVASRDRRGAVIEIERALKGGLDQTIRVTSAFGMCDADLVEDSRRLVFLDARGHVVGGFQGDIALPDTDAGASWIEILGRWGAATDDKARLEVLLKVIAQPEGSLGRNPAGEFLTNTPRLLALIDPPAIARIAKSLVGNRWHPNYVILILFRLRSAELTKLLDATPTAWSYRDEMRAVLAADRFGSIKDRAVLAAAITARNASVATRTAALDRCEMVRGERLESFVRYLYDAARDADTVDWKRLAAACKR